MKSLFVAIGTGILCFLSQQIFGQLSEPAVSLLKSETWCDSKYKDCTETISLDSLKVTYLLKLDVLNSLDFGEGFKRRMPYYKLFIDFGDGTFEQHNILAPSSTFPVRLKPGPRKEKLEFIFEHTYTSYPLNDIAFYSTVIYSDDNPPPKKLVSPNEELQLDLSKLPKNSRRYILPSEEEQKPVNIYINKPPVPGDVMNCVINYRSPDINEKIDSGYLFFFYNVAGMKSDGFSIDTTSVDTYQGEEILTLDFREFLETEGEGEGEGEDPSLDPNNFSNALILKVKDLAPREFRTIHFPISCSEKLGEDFDTQVSFLSIFIGSKQLAALLDNRDLITEIEVARTNVSTFFTLPFPRVPRLSSGEGSGEVVVISGRAIVPRIRGVALAAIELNQKITFVELDEELASEANSRIFAVDHYPTQVMAALDPNKSILRADFFCKRKMSLINTIVFENEGTAAAERVEARILFNDKFKAEEKKIKIINHSIGTIRPLGFKNDTICQNCFAVEISGIYLSGPNEKISKSFGEFSMLVETDLKTDREDVFLDAAIIFNTEKPVAVEEPDTSLFFKGQGGRQYYPKIIPLILPISGAKVGLNYPFVFDDLTASPNLSDNFVYHGIWAPFRISRRLGVQMEYGLSNIGLMDPLGTRYRMCTFEGTIKGAFSPFPRSASKFLRRTSMGLGGGVMRRLNVFIDDEKANLSDDEYDKWYYHAFADLNIYLFRLNLYILKPSFVLGVRGNHYFNPTFAGREKNSAIIGQAYLNIWF